MLHIVQVINKNKLRWFGHVTRREEVKETKRKNKNKTAIDNIDSHLNGKDTSPNDVLETKCFQNVQYLEDIDFTTNWQEFWGRSLSFYPEYGEQMSRPCLFSAM